MKALNEDSGVKQPCGWLAEVRRGEFGGNLIEYQVYAVQRQACDAARARILFTLAIHTYTTLRNFENHSI